LVTFAVIEANVVGPALPANSLL